MKNIIILSLAVFLTTALSAQVPNGTYLPCNDIAKSMYIEKAVFNANKVVLYFGTMGMTLGFEEFDYEIQEMDKELPFVQVYFEYDKTNDLLVFGESYTNSILGDMLGPMENSAKLMYNKSGNCNPNLKSNNKIRILVKDNNQDVSAEILNNYLKIPDNTDIKNITDIIPRLDKAKAIKSGKYTDAQITAAAIILHDGIENYLRGLQNKIVAANLILKYIENNSVTIADGIAKIYFIFSPAPKLSKPDYLDEFGILGDWFFEWAKRVAEKSLPSFGKFYTSEINKEDVKTITTILEEMSESIKLLMDENERINKLCNRIN